MDYVKEADRVRDRFIDLIVNSGSENWKLAKESSEVIVETSPEKLFAMVCPVKPYRIQWDDLLDTLETAEKLDSHRYLIYHVTHPAAKGFIHSTRYIISESGPKFRDPIATKTTGGVEHPDHPPKSKFVRTHQYPAGYVIEKIPDNPNQCKWTMLLHIDLSMGQLMSFVVDKVKPTLMIQKVEALRKECSYIAHHFAKTK